MRKFLIKLSCFILVVLVLFAFLEYKARRVPNDYSVKNALLSEYCQSLNTIIIGNSQAYFGIDPVYFRNKTFNAAHVSEPLNMDAFILNKYLPQMDSLKNIIVSISSFTPFSYWKPGGKGEAWRIKHYHLYYGYPTSFFDIKNNLELYDLNFPNDMRWAKACMGRSLTYTDSLGFGHNYLSYHKTDWEDCSNAVRIHSSGFFPDNPNVLENKEVLCSIAQNNKSRTIYLVFFPVWHTYSDLMNEEQITAVRDFCKQIECVNDNVVFVDLYKDSRFLAEDFADAYHLSEVGAKKLALILDDLIAEK